MGGIRIRAAGVARRDLGRVRHHRPAAHRGADETPLGPVQPVELAALGRGGAQDRAAGSPADLPGRLRPDLGHAPAGHLGRADDRRVRDDLPGTGAAITGGIRAARLRRAALHERVHVPDARARRCHLRGPDRPVLLHPRSRDGLRLPGAHHHLHARAGTGLRRARGRQPADPLASRPPARRDQAPAPLCEPRPPGDLARQPARGRALDRRDPPEPSLPSRTVVLPGAALGPVVAGLPDDRSR